MEKNKVLLTDKVTKENIKSPTFKRWVMRVLCFACILSLALQLAMCVAPLETYAAEDDGIVGTWVLNQTVDLTTANFNLVNGNGDMEMYAYVSPLFSTITADQLVPMQVIQLVSWTNRIEIFCTNTSSVKQFNQYDANGWTAYYASGSNYKSCLTNDVLLRTLVIERYSASSGNFAEWLNSNATKVVETVYDFTGEFRIFKPTLSILFTDTAVVQSYNFDFNVYGGYNADYLIINSQADRVTMSYSFTDEGSGGLRMVYRQGFDDDTGTWLVPRARVIYFQSNPDDPTFQQWLLDNTYLVAPDTIDVLYDFGYQNGYNDGWTNNVIGDTLNAPLQALNNMVLLQTTDVTVTMGGVIVAMISLSILIVFLKKYAGG